MAIILFTLAAGVLLISIFMFFQTKLKERTYRNHEGHLSDAWKRIDGEKVKGDNRRKSLQSKSKSIADDFRDNDTSFLSDILLRTFKSRRDYYRDVYLKSAAWQRKRFVVLRRDNWCCSHCGRPATQVHHKRYAKRIGKEPIEWLESVCQACHDSLHR